RVREHPCVVAEVAAVEEGAREDAADEWIREFGRDLSEAIRDIREALSRGPEGVLQYLRRHPPYQLCFLKELVCCLLDQPEQARKYQFRVGFWLYLDWLLRRMTCSCWSCRPDRGVPLARVVLARTGARKTDSCRVMFIDASLPHRRLIRRDPCRPLRAGTIDLAPYLFQKKEALGQLRLSGVNV